MYNKEVNLDLTVSIKAGSWSLWRIALFTVHSCMQPNPHSIIFDRAVHIGSFRTMHSYIIPVGSSDVINKAYDRVPIVHRLTLEGQTIQVQNIMILKTHIC